MGLFDEGVANFYVLSTGSLQICIIFFNDP